MAIVLPRKKKKIDIFAPSQAIQDAKNKLGPAYFDVTLLECSQNAVELTKLVGKWGDIDKAKLKVIQNIEREQRLLLRFLKHYRSVSDDDTCKNDVIESIETPDGKTITPGFRFKSNGELKASAHNLAHIPSHSDPTERGATVISQKSRSSAQDDVHESSVANKTSTYNSVDYDKEIKELQEVINAIYADLARNKSKILAERNRGTKTFLRAHSHDVVLQSTKSEELSEQRAPNDRFAFQPGTSKMRDSYLYQQKLKTPSHHTCVGCQYKLKQTTDDMTKTRKLHESVVGKIKWSYVPHGRVVQSSTTIYNRSPSVTKSAMRRPDSKKDLHTKSSVHFNIKDDVKARSTVSSLRERPQSGKDDNNKRSVSVPSLRCGRGRCTHGSSDVGSEGSRTLSSSLSYGSGLSRTRVSSSLLVDYESRLHMLKSLQAAQEERCEVKVKEFLHKLDSCSNAPDRNQSGTYV